MVGRLADALEETLPFEGKMCPFQVEVVGPGQLRPTTHDVILSFVAEDEGEAAATEPPVE